MVNTQVRGSEQGEMDKGDDGAAAGKALKALTRPQPAYLRPMTAADKKRRDELEEQIERSLMSWLEMGRALAVIHEESLWRDKFPSFRAYMVARWSFKAARAMQIILAVPAYDDVHDVTDVIPQNEAQLRPLVSQPTPIRRRVWKETVKEYGQPTEDRVRETLRRILHGSGEDGDGTEQQDFRRLYRHMIERLDQAQRYCQEHPRITRLDDEARAFLKRLIGAVRDVMRFRN